MTAVATRTPFVRQATIEDVPAVQAMFETFVRTSQYQRYVGTNAAASTRLIAHLVTHDDGGLFVVQAEDGLIGMFGIMIYAHPFSGERVAVEAFWWLHPDRRGYGVYLLRRAERWAAAHGARRLSMMAPADKPRVAEIYEALGYDRVEITYQKDLR